MSLDWDYGIMVLRRGLSVICENSLQFRAQVRYQNKPITLVLGFSAA